MTIRFASLKARAGGVLRSVTAVFIATVALCFAPASLAAESDITIRLSARYDVQKRQPRIMREFLVAHPAVKLEQWEGIRLPVGGASASLAMGMAGQVGPDIFEMDIRQAVEQGLAVSLATWIGRDGELADGTPKRDADGSIDRNGLVDADEAKWAGWMELPPLFRLVCTVDGEPYALPGYSGTYVGLLFSRRLLAKANLDPDAPPRSWDEFAYWCRCLYNHDTATPAVELFPYAWCFAPWVASAGTSILLQDRVSPTTGKTYTFHEQETNLRAPDTGEDLAGAPVRWRANVAHPDAAAALAFYHRLRWAPWIRDPVSGDPVELSKEDVNRGQVEVAGRIVTFSSEHVVEGCIAVPGTSTEETLRRLGRDLAIVPWEAQNLVKFENLGVSPEDLGMLAYPGKTQAHKSVLQYSCYFNMIGKDALHRGGDTQAQRDDYLDLVWGVLQRICSVEGENEEIRRKVAAGQARFLNPRDLTRLGYDDYLKEIPTDYMRLWERIDSGDILLTVEPFMGKWLQFRDFYQREAIGLVLRPTGKHFDYVAALETLERDANSGIMFARPAEELDVYRPRARLIAAIIVCIIVLFLVMIVRDQVSKTASTAGVFSRWLPWVMLVPALASVMMWKYYPLLRGLLMAFQDYRISGDSEWVGLTNFIGIMLDPNFYHYLATTFRFVMWNLLLAFFTPIFLALLLTEVPRFKVFFRTLFFLPQMTSGLVVTLLWRDMFRGTASGTINRCLGPVLKWMGLGPVDWLGNPATVMACVIIPGVWASAGISSLIYVAALKSVPDELYEAASIDGAGMLRRAWRITLPTIMPLVLINFVGAFIATFQGMGSIFLLTFGGPGKETMVMSMAIWQEAYLNLRFHMATAYAWILGSILIGFTYLQLRILRRVDFRRAAS